MKQIAFICLLPIMAILFGCDREEYIISDMLIEDFRVHVSDISEDITALNENLPYYEGLPFDKNSVYYAVIVLVHGGFGGCTRYNRTRIFENAHDEIGPFRWPYERPTWEPNSTINIQITQADPTSKAFDCATIWDPWHNAIFVGFCLPGEYTIVVNNLSKTLTLPVKSPCFSLWM